MANHLIEANEKVMAAREVAQRAYDKIMLPPKQDEAEHDPQPKKEK